VVGVTAGASTPENVVQAVIDRLRTLGATSVENCITVEEDTVFQLPPGLKQAVASSSAVSSERLEERVFYFLIGGMAGAFLAWCGIAILIVYLTLSIGSVFTAAPQTDEAVLANPGYNLVHHHNMGTTLYQLGDYMPSSLAQHTYWLPPLHFVTTAVWFQIWGFGMPQLRLLSVLFGMLAIISWFLVVYHLQKVGWMALLAAGLVSTDYFFLIGASHGRMDIMCASLGAAALASYAAFRERSLKKAVLCSHTLAALALVTHPAGIVYPAGLLVMVLWLDAQAQTDRAERIKRLNNLIANIPPDDPYAQMARQVLKDEDDYQHKITLAAARPRISLSGAVLRALAFALVGGGCASRLYQKRTDTVGEITIRRQKPLVLRIMVEQGRTRILFLSGLTPRCKQIFLHGC